MTEAEKLQALAAKHAAGERLTNADGVLDIDTRGDSLMHSSAYMEAQLRGYGEKEERQPWKGRVYVGSGAGPSLTSQQLADSLGLVLRPLAGDNLYLKSATGENMRVAGKAEAVLDLVGGYSAHWSFYVVPKFAHGVLLGKDFMRARRCCY